MRRGTESSFGPKVSQPLPGLLKTPPTCLLYPEVGQTAEALPASESVIRFCLEPSHLLIRFIVSSPNPSE